LGFNVYFCLCFRKSTGNSYFRIWQSFGKTCDICLIAKRYFSLRPPPLHPLPVPTAPFSHWALDHKTLTRKTKQGNVAILCCVDAFSGWPVLRAVKDLTAFTTAKLFFERVVAQYGKPILVLSDRGPAFGGVLIKHMAKLLNITHRTSSATTARLNGLAESCVKRVGELLKIYAKNDTEIKDVLPVLEMALRSTANTRLELSPCHLIYGKKMPVNEPNFSINTSPFTGDYKQYFDWLGNDLKILHEAVRENKQEIKLEDKKQYDRKNAVITPAYAVGDQVLLYDNRISPHSDQILTHRNYALGPFYIAPFYIAQLVQGKDDIGLNYKLIDVKTGKSFRRLVSADRLKPYTADRTDLLARLPFNLYKEQQAVDTTNSDQDQNKTTDEAADPELSGCEAAKRIFKKRVRNKKKEFLVLFADGSKARADFVTPTLLQLYRLLQDRQRQKKRKRRRLTDGR